MKSRTILIITFIVVIGTCLIALLIFGTRYREKLIEWWQQSSVLTGYMQITNEENKCGLTNKILEDEGFQIPISVEAYFIQHKLHSCNVPTTCGQACLGTEDQPDEHLRPRSRSANDAYQEQPKILAKTRNISLPTYDLSTINEAESNGHSNEIHRKSILMIPEYDSNVALRKISAPENTSCIEEGSSDQEVEYNDSRKLSAPANLGLPRKVLLSVSPKCSPTCVRKISTGNLDYAQYRKSQSMIYKQGKIRFQVQYNSVTKNRLVITLQEIEQKSECDDVVYISITLLPVRSFTHISLKQIYNGKKAKFYDKFYLTCITFPTKIEYASHTILMKIFHANNFSDHELVGEARYNLLNKDIYNDIPSSISLHIKPVPTQNEIGDAEVILNYSSKTSELVVCVSSVIFINEKSAKHDVEIKINLKRKKTTRVMKLMNRTTDEHASDSDDQESTAAPHIGEHKQTRTRLGKRVRLQLMEEDFLVTTMTLNLSRGLRLLGKNNGIVCIGHRYHDVCGKEHWRSANDSPGTEIVMWHPIYDA